MKTLSRTALLGAASAFALVGGPALTALAAAAKKASQADVDALNAALELERAAIAAYQAGIKTGYLTPQVITVANGFIADHTAHREALLVAIRAADATPSDRVAAVTYPTLASQPDVLRFALGLEKKAAATYLSVVPEFENRKLAEAAASILGVETTHVSVLSQALGEASYPGGFVH